MPASSVWGGACYSIVGLKKAAANFQDTAFLAQELPGNAAFFILKNVLRRNIQAFSIGMLR